MRFENVTADARANVYFDGKVVSHTIHLATGGRRTLGLIFPGSYHFGTDAAEVMEITDGACRVRLDGSDRTLEVAAGGRFEVPAKSGFTVEVTGGICQYVCAFAG
jgi:purine/pyrimidine-nucleoside phosphorylase